MNSEGKGILFMDTSTGGVAPNGVYFIPDSDVLFPLALVGASNAGIGFSSGAYTADNRLLYMDRYRGTTVLTDLSAGYTGSERIVALTEVFMLSTQTAVVSNCGVIATADGFFMWRGSSFRKITRPRYVKK
jgi:hypothetical protein